MVIMNGKDEAMYISEMNLQSARDTVDYIREMERYSGGSIGGSYRTDDIKNILFKMKDCISYLYEDIIIPQQEDIKKLQEDIKKLQEKVDNNLKQPFTITSSDEKVSVAYQLTETNTEEDKELAVANTTPTINQNNLPVVNEADCVTTADIYDDTSSISPEDEEDIKAIIKFIEDEETDDEEAIIDFLEKTDRSAEAYKKFIKWRASNPNFFLS